MVDEPEETPSGLKPSTIWIMFAAQLKEVAEKRQMTDEIAREPSVSG